MIPVISDKKYRKQISDQNGIAEVSFSGLIEEIGSWMQENKIKKAYSVKILTFSFDRYFIEELSKITKISSDDIKICSSYAPSVSGWDSCEENDNPNFVVIGTRKNHAKLIIIDGSGNKKLAVLGSFNATRKSMQKIESAEFVSDSRVYNEWDSIFEYLFGSGVYEWIPCEKDEGRGPIEPRPMSPLVPFDFQADIISNTLECIEDAEESDNLDKGYIIKMLTGTGKTVVGAEVLKRRLENVKTGSVLLWLAPREELLEQAIVVLGRQCSELKAKPKIGYYKDRNNEIRFKDDAVNTIMSYFGSAIEEANVLFSTYHSAAPILHKLDSSVDLVVIDECHRFHPGSGYAQKIFELTPQAVRIGLTGTLVNDKQFDEYWYTENIVNCNVEKEDLVNNGYIAKENVIRVHIGTISVPAINLMKVDLDEYEFENISGVRDFESQEIDEKITEKLNDALSRNRKRILIFLPTIDRCESIEEHLKEIHGANSILSHHSRLSWGVRSANTRKFRQPVESNKALVMLTVQTASEGLDVPKIDCLLLVRPTFSKILMEQMIGRGLRGIKLDGTSECDIYDFTYSLEDNNGNKLNRTETGELKIQEATQLVNKEESELLDNLPRNLHWRLISEVKPSDLTTRETIDLAKKLEEKGLVEFTRRGQGGYIRLVSRRFEIDKTKVSQEKIIEIGSLTVNSAINEDRHEEIAAITGISKSKVKKILVDVDYKQKHVKSVDSLNWPT